MNPNCDLGKHRTLVQIDTGKPLKNPNIQSMICLQCGKSFAAVGINPNDKDIEEVLKLAAEQTRNNLQSLRIK